MPRLSQWFVRASFLYLLAGFTVGALLLANKGVPLHPALWSLLPVHIEFLLVGWIVQLTLGVAFWIMPRYWDRARRPAEWPAWLAFGLLNAGILLVAATAIGRASWLWWGRLLELVGVVLFAVYIRRRIVSREGQF